jgi:hypothetical protein
MAHWLMLMAALALPRAAAASCVDDAKPYDEAELRGRIAWLASPELDGRAAGSAGDESARAYIAARFRCLGLEPGGVDGGYEQPVVVDGKPAANVVGYVKGSDARVGAEVILVGAHHDHLGGGRLGANDNASGVAALLAVAQAVRQHTAPRRTILFVTFDGEEAGLLGSAELVAHPPAVAPLDRIVAVVNLDMLGSYTARGVVYAFGTFPGSAARAFLERPHPGLHVGLGGHSERGDHLAFCRRGVPYTFFWTPDPRCYHERCDTADRIDGAPLTAIATLAGGLVEELAQTALDLAGARRRGCGAP